MTPSNIYVLYVTLERNGLTLTTKTFLLKKSSNSTSVLAPNFTFIVMCFFSRINNQQNEWNNPKRADGRRSALTDKNPSSYLSQHLQHLCSLVLFALLGHEHHLLDHSNPALIRRWWWPPAGQPVSWPQHEGGQHVSTLLGGCPPPAVLRTGSSRLLAFGLLGSHGDGSAWTLEIRMRVPPSSHAEAALIFACRYFDHQTSTADHILWVSDQFGATRAMGVPYALHLKVQLLLNIR